jgi:hypothetical protein
MVYAQNPRCRRQRRWSRQKRRKPARIQFEKSMTTAVKWISVQIGREWEALQFSCIRNTARRCGCMVDEKGGAIMGEAPCNVRTFTV